MAEDEGLLPPDTVRIQVGEDAALSDDAAAALDDLARALAAQAEGGDAEVVGFEVKPAGMMTAGGPSTTHVDLPDKMPLPQARYRDATGRGVRRCAVDVSIVLPTWKV